MPVALIAAPLAFVVVLLLVPGLQMCGLFPVFTTPSGLRGPDEKDGARDGGAGNADRGHYAPQTFAWIEGSLVKISSEPITESCRLKLQIWKSSWLRRMPDRNEG
jgi:hypothetical protein